MRPSRVVACLFTPLVLVACVAGAPGTPPLPLGTGALTGFVFGAAGKAEPLTRVLVVAGDRTGQTTPVVTDPQTDVDDGAAQKVVVHDFADGKGAVPCLRILAHGGAALPPGEPRYVYLRKGEYYLDGLQPGQRTITATVPGVDADGVTYKEFTASTTVMVLAGKTVPDVNLRVVSNPGDKPGEPLPSAAPAASASAGASATPRASGSPAPAATASASASPTVIHTLIPIVQVTPSATATPTAAPTATPTPRPSATATAKPTASPTATPTPTPTPTPTATPTATPTPAA